MQKESITKAELMFFQPGLGLKNCFFFLGAAEVKYLDKVSILDALLAEEKKQVANALVEMHFASEDRIIQQGEPGNMSGTSECGN